jgi:hypothetical protein
MKKKEDRLIQAVSKMADLPDENKVNIKGKLYAEVHTRVQAFRLAYGEEGRIMTMIHQHDDEKVMTETTIQILRNDRWDTIGNDFAEEYRGVGMVNKTSALENCITSSIGRALSSCALSGGNYASFEEVDHAMNGKAESKPVKSKPVKKKATDATPTEKDLANADEMKTVDQAKLFSEGFIKYSVFHDDNIESFTNWYKRNFASIRKLQEIDPETREEFDAKVIELTDKIKQKQQTTEVQND